MTGSPRHSDGRPERRTTAVPQDEEVRAPGGTKSAPSCPVVIHRVKENQAEEGATLPLGKPHLNPGSFLLSWLKGAVAPPLGVPALPEPQSTAPTAAAGLVPEFCCPHLLLGTSPDLYKPSLQVGHLVLGVWVPLILSLLIWAGRGEPSVPGGQGPCLTGAARGCGMSERARFGFGFWSRVPVLLCDLEQVPCPP